MPTGPHQQSRGAAFSTSRYRKRQVLYQGIENKRHLLTKTKCLFSKQAGLTIAPSFSSPLGFPSGIARAAGQAPWTRMFLAAQDPVPQSRAPQAPTEPWSEGTRQTSAAHPPRSNATSWAPGTNPRASTDGLAQAADPSRQVLFRSRTFTFKHQLHPDSWLRGSK